MTIAEFIAQEMRGHGIEHAFGIPGGEVATILDALHREGIQFVLTSHEAGAAFMADAYYRRTGKMALVLATLGPGATNAVSGAAQAYLDRSPILFITGTVSHDLKNVYPHQILNHVQMFGPVTKWSQEISSDNVATVISQTFKHMTGNVPGPVHLDLPVDVALQEFGDPKVAPPEGIASEGERDAVALGHIVSQLQGSQRPVFIVGLEAADDSTAEMLYAVVDRQKIPVLTTYKAKGVLPESHPLSLGALGLSPRFDQIAGDYLRSSDLVLALGVDPVELRSDWLAVWADLRPIGIGPSATKFSGFPSRIAWSGPPSEFLATVGNLPLPRRYPEQSAALKALRAQHEARWEAAEAFSGAIPSGILAPHQVLLVIDQECADAVITIDTGAMRIAANHIIRAHKPNQILQSNGLGTMGYAVPAAIGAQIAGPSDRVVALTGDAGLSMLIGEFSTAAAFRLPLVVVVFVDQSLALIDLKQSRMRYQHVGVDVFAPNFAGIAEQFGGHGFIPTSVEQFRQQLRIALKTRDGLTVIHVPIDPRAYDALM